MLQNPVISTPIEECKYHDKFASGNFCGLSIYELHVCTLVSQICLFNNFVSFFNVQSK